MFWSISVTVHIVEYFFDEVSKNCTKRWSRRWSRFHAVTHSFRIQILINITIKKRQIQVIIVVLFHCMNSEISIVSQHFYVRFHQRLVNSFYFASFDVGLCVTSCTTWLFCFCCFHNFCIEYLFWHFLWQSSNFEVLSLRFSFFTTNRSWCNNVVSNSS